MHICVSVCALLLLTVEVLPLQSIFKFQLLANDLQTKFIIADQIYSVTLTNQIGASRKLRLH